MEVWFLVPRGVEILVCVGVVSRALTWATKGDAPTSDSRIRRPFQTHRIGFARSSLFKSTKFHFDSRDIKTQEGSGEIDIVVEPVPAPIHWEYIGLGKKVLVDPSPQTASLVAIQERVREALKKALASEEACHRRSLSTESHILIQRDAQSDVITQPSTAPKPVPSALSQIQERVEGIPEPADSPPIDFPNPSPPRKPDQPSRVLEVLPESSPVRFVLPPVKGMKKSSFHKPYHVAGNVSNQSSFSQPHDYSAIEIQRVWRGYFARKRFKLSKIVHNIFDPYFRDSPRARRNKLASGWTLNRLPSFGEEVSFSN